MQRLKSEHTYRLVVLGVVIVICLMVFGLMAMLVAHLMFADLPMGEPPGLVAVALPHVGIFWRVAAGRVAPMFVCEASLVSEAERYGDCLGHPHGHFETWEHWRMLDAEERAKRGLPGSVVHHEYEDFPRGRIVYQCTLAQFVIYADPRLQGRRTRAEIVSRFSLQEEPVRFALDAHYRRSC